MVAASKSIRIAIRGSHSRSCFRRSRLPRDAESRLSDSTNHPARHYTYSSMSDLILDYPWLSLLPPLAAIGLAIATRRVVVSLAAGVFVGALILAGGNLWKAIRSTVSDHLWPSLIDFDHIQVFVFTTLMGAMIGVVHKSGGMHGVVESLAPLAKNRRGGQLLTWFLGLLVFIDDYANSLLLGNTMRPLTDRLRISREKLAYLVDSTAAPVSGLALISTWVAGEIGYIESGFKGLEMAASADGFAVFVNTIPFRFYVLWALVLVPLTALLGRDFGPMVAAELRCLKEQPADEKSATTEKHPTEPDSDAPQRWFNAVIPILMTIAVTVAWLVVTGLRSLDESQADDRSLMQIVGAGDSYSALVFGSLSGFSVAAVLAWSQRILNISAIARSAVVGARAVVPALVILWLAWSLSGITKAEYLGTAEYLGGIFERAIDVRWMPTMVFIVASLIAFSTGTSWGTMAILMPLVIGTTFRMLTAGGEEVTPDNTLLLGAIAGVLAGAIFGDHCSPISDTTVLSSQASGCDHIAHVRTQLPYALLVGTVSILFGTIPIGFGASVWVMLPIGPCVLVGWLLLVGRRQADVETA